MLSVRSLDFQFCLEDRITQSIREPLSTGATGWSVSVLALGIKARPPFARTCRFDNCKVFVTVMKPTDKRLDAQNKRPAHGMPVYLVTTVPSRAIRRSWLTAGYHFQPKIKLLAWPHVPNDHAQDESTGEDNR
jgi:DNA-directed RNA polymerase